MLENVTKAFIQYDADMQKAEKAKANALEDLNKSFQIKSKKGFYYVPEKAKSAEAYSRQYKEILSAYEKAIAEAKPKCKALAEAAIVKANADIIVKAQKAPDTETLNCIKALEMLKPENVTKEEILMLMENSRNYIACKALNQVAQKANIAIPMNTLPDALEVLERVKKEVADFFYYYNPLSYKTVSSIQGKNAFINAADEVLDDFMNGYYAKDSSFMETISDLKLKSSTANEAAKAEKKKHDEEIEKFYNSLTEAEKLELYSVLKN